MATISSNASANRVVSLNGLGPGRSPGHRILNECRDQLVSELCLWLRDIAAPVSEELFVLADSTRERLQQTRYLDLRAEIEKDWSHLVETFRRDLSTEAERCQNKDAENGGNRESTLEIPDFEGLQLLADDDLSEHIVIREFSAQLCESCDEELYTLDRRVATLFGLDELPDNANPLAPPVICRALSDACATFGSGSEERLILLRRLERHLHLGLPPIYKEINAYLIERGILPDLKRNYRKTPSASETSSAPAFGAQPTVSGATGATPIAAEGILDALQRLAQARTSQMQTPIGGAFSGTGTPSGGALNAAPGNAAGGQQGVMLDAATVNQLLLASLNEMQHAPLGEAGGAIVNQVRIVRDSEGAKQVSGLEAVTIDIVAMLFDFIFEGLCSRNLWSGSRSEPDAEDTGCHGAYAPTYPGGRNAQAEHEANRDPAAATVAKPVESCCCRDGRIGDSLGSDGSHRGSRFCRNAVSALPIRARASARSSEWFAALSLCRVSADVQCLERHATLRTA